MKYTHIFRKIFKKKTVNYSAVSLAADKSMSNRIQSGKGSVFKYTVDFDDGTKESFVGKYKSSVIIIKGAKMLAQKNIFLLIGILLYNKILGYKKSWKREAVLYSNMPQHLKQSLPELYGFVIKPFVKKSFLAMREFTHGTPICKNDICRIIDVLSPVHNYYYNRNDLVKELCVNNYSVADYKSTKRILKKLFNNLNDENIKIFGESKIRLINDFIDCIDKEYEKVSFHKTLTHNDFSNRNIVMFNNRVIVYDWELACFQNPEHDIVELIVSVMDDMSYNEIMEAFEYHRKSLEADISVKEYRMFLRFNLLEYCVNKLSLLRYAETMLNVNCAQRIVKNTAVLIDMLINEQKEEDNE